MSLLIISMSSTSQAPHVSSIYDPLMFLVAHFETCIQFSTVCDGKSPSTIMGG